MDLLHLSLSLYYLTQYNSSRGRRAIERSACLTRRRKGNIMVDEGPRGTVPWHVMSDESRAGISAAVPQTWRVLFHLVLRASASPCREHATVFHPPSSCHRRLLLLRGDHVIFGIGNARRDTLSLCRRLTLHRRRFIDVNGLISPVPGHGTSDHVGEPASPLHQSRGGEEGGADWWAQTNNLWLHIHLGVDSLRLANVSTHGHSLRPQNTNSFRRGPRCLKDIGDRSMRYRGGGEI